MGASESLTGKPSSLPIWEPTIGREFNRFLTTLETEQQRSRVADESRRILSACVQPLPVAKPGTSAQCRQNAGLILGHVQSGKTSSFIGTAALAHDNGFGLVIVVGGTSRILLDQTYSRLVQHLKLDAGDAVNRWIKLKNPKNNGDPVEQQVRHFIQQHASSGLMVGSPVPLIAVMKSASHLKKLDAFLELISGPSRDQLSDLSVLIVDDECHMSTPNVASGADEKSRIYELMGRIRSHFPRHTLLQYTATPQANLLCEIEDEFRPDFVRLLGHGDGYRGGSRFFRETPAGRLIRTIPPAEQEFLRVEADKDDVDVCIPSLRRAFATFLLAAADDRLFQIQSGQFQFQRVSMLVHADSQIDRHMMIQAWLSALRTSWGSLLAEGDHHADRLELVEEEFLPAYEDLAGTVQRPLSPLQELMREQVSSVLGQTVFWLVNGTKEGTNQPDFAVSNYNVLNGGEMLAVGFTVPGLHVTHMLRGPGQNQMDTIQQRGRFFGYCGAWFDRVRVWLPEDVKSAFEGYVDEEEWLRRDLDRYDRDDLPLRGWKVRLRLEPGARPTRRAAIRRDVAQFRTEEGWVYQNHWNPNPEARARNRQIVGEFLAGIGDFADLRNGQLVFSDAPPELKGVEPATDHQVAVADVEGVRRLIALLSPAVQDRGKFSILSETIDQWLSDSDMNRAVSIDAVDVFGMARSNDLKQARRRRSYNEQTHHIDLLQGSNQNYCGDRKVHTLRLSVQIHNLKHGPSDNEIWENNVPYIAVWLPSEPRAWAENWLIER